METHIHRGTRTPTDVLREEHVVILRALTLLEHFGERLEAGELVDQQELAWLRAFFCIFADRCHHGKEEQHLFPALERRGITREGGPLGVMLQEHEEGRALLGAMAEGNDRRTAEAIRAYVRLLRVHIDKENGVLLPLAEQVLSEEEQRELAQAFEQVEQAIASPFVHDRLLAELARLEGR